MKQGWKEIELSYFVNDFIVPQRDKPKVFDGDVPWCRIEDFNGIYLSDTKTNQYVNQKTIKEMGLKVYPVNTLIVSCSADLGKCAIIKRPLVTNQTFIGLVPSENVDSKFLYYYMSSIAKKLNEMASGATIKYLSKKKFQELVVCFPPLPEQQRIVAILDEAFASIAKAKANAEQNLKNAKELFESVLNSINAEKVELGSLVNITTGKLNANAAVEGGEYPFFTCSREIYSIDNYAFDLEALLLAGNNASGDFNVKHYKGKFNAYQRTYVITVNENRKAIYRYLYFQLLKSLKEFKELSVGTNTRFLKLGMIQGLKIALPSIEQQQTIVRQLDALRAETQKLEAVYQQKLADLEELKKSILQKAFAGELTDKSKVS
jgi:type I restriction enzyme S subunit